MARTNKQMWLLDLAQFSCFSFRPSRSLTTRAHTLRRDDWRGGSFGQRPLWWWSRPAGELGEPVIESCYLDGLFFSDLLALLVRSRWSGVC